MEFWPLSDGFNANKFCIYIDILQLLKTKKKETVGESFMC